MLLYVVSRYIDDIGSGIICILLGGFAVGCDHFLVHRHMPHVRDGSRAIAIAIPAPTCCTTCCIQQGWHNIAPAVLLSISILRLYKGTASYEQAAL